MSRMSSNRSRREQIVSAARACFAEKGLEKTKISDIVQRAKVAQGTFYLYFPSKSHLVLALGEEMCADVLEAVETIIRDEQHFAGILSAGIRATFEQLANYKDIYPIVANGGGLVDDPQQWSKLFLPFYDLLESQLQHYQNLGQMDANLDPHMCARLIVVIVDKAVEEYLLHKPETDMETIIQQVIRFVKNALCIQEEAIETV